MPKKPLSSAVRRKYEFIKPNQKEHSVQMMCRLLNVAPSGYYAWLSKPVSDRAREDRRLLGLIRASFNESQGVYGAPRVFLDLREAGETCSKHRVARLMKENGMASAPNNLKPQHPTNRLVSTESWELQLISVRALGSVLVRNGMVPSQAFKVPNTCSTVCRRTTAA